MPTLPTCAQLLYLILFLERTECRMIHLHMYDRWTSVFLRFLVGGGLAQVDLLPAVEYILRPHWLLSIYLNISQRHETFSPESRSRVRRLAVVPWVKMPRGRLRCDEIPYLCCRCVGG
jgi:hypothetical protein